jgi:hypothetical protein
MKFLMMLTDIAGEWDRVPAAEQARIMEGHGVVGSELRAQQKLMGSYRLRAPPTRRRRSGCCREATAPSPMGPSPRPER